jgi:hypothetical protein
MIFGIQENLTGIDFNLLKILYAAILLANQKIPPLGFFALLIRNLGSDKYKTIGNKCTGGKTLLSGSEALKKSSNTTGTKS